MLCFFKIILHWSIGHHLVVLVLCDGLGFIIFQGRRVSCLSITSVKEWYCKLVLDCLGSFFFLFFGAFVLFRTESALAGSVSPACLCLYVRLVNEVVVYAFVD